jgi:DNA polymerase-3 subunit gamma/tau
MRDAESILDQVISFSGKEIKGDAIVSILGLVGFDTIAAFMDKIFEKEPAPLLELFQELVFQGQDFRLFLKELMEYVRNLIVLKVSKESKKLISLASEEIDRLKGQAEKVSLDELHQIFKIISDVELEVKRSSYPVMLVEMALIRLTEIRPFQSIESILESLSQIGKKIESEGTDKSSQIKENTLHSDNLIADSNFGDTEKIWEKIKIKTREKKGHLGMFLDNGKLINLTENTLEIGFPDRFTLERMQKDENKKILSTAVSEVLNEKFRVLMKEYPDKNEKKESKNKENRTEQEESNESDREIVQEALNIFEGEVIREE